MGPRSGPIRDGSRSPGVCSVPRDHAWPALVLLPRLRSFGISIRLLSSRKLLERRIAALEPSEQLRRTIFGAVGNHDPLPILIDLPAVSIAVVARVLLPGPSVPWGDGYVLPRPAVDSERF